MKNAVFEKRWIIELKFDKGKNREGKEKCIKECEIERGESTWWSAWQDFSRGKVVIRQLYGGEFRGMIHGV